MLLNNISFKNRLSFKYDRVSRVFCGHFRLEMTLVFTAKSFKYDKKNDSPSETKQRAKNPCSSSLKEGHLHFAKTIITFEETVIRHIETRARHHIERTAASFQNDSFVFH